MILLLILAITGWGLFLIEVWDRRYYQKQSDKWYEIVLEQDNKFQKLDKPNRIEGDEWKDDYGY